MFVNNVSHRQHLKNRYIYKLAINNDKALSSFRTILRQCFSKKLPRAPFHWMICFSTLYTLFSSEQKYQFIVTDDDLCFKNKMHNKLICWKFILLIIYNNTYRKGNGESEVTKRFYTAAKRHRTVGSQRRSTISNMTKFLPLLLGL